MKTENRRSMCMVSQTVSCTPNGVWCKKHPLIVKAVHFFLCSMKYFLKGRERGTGYAEACTWNRVQATSNQPKIENFTLKITAARDYFPESEVVLSKNCLDDIDDQEWTNEQMVKPNEANKNEEAQFKLLAFNGMLDKKN